MDKSINEDPAPYNTEEDHDFMRSIWKEYNRIYRLRKLEAKLLEKAMCKIEKYVMNSEGKNDKS